MVDNMPGKAAIWNRPGRNQLLRPYESNDVVVIFLSSPELYGKPVFVSVKCLRGDFPTVPNTGRERDYACIHENIIRIQTYCSNTQ